MSEERVSSALRNLVTERAQGCCEYCRCQSRFAAESLSVEHIVPRSQGGATSADNTCLSCQGCNNHKYTNTTGRDPATGELVPLYHPRRQRWTDHFSWSIDYSRIVGVTPTGRATVAELRLNRRGLVNLRRVLFAAAKHPPDEPGEEPQTK